MLGWVRERGGDAMEAMVDRWFEVVVILIELLTSLLIVVGVAEATWRIIGHLRRGPKNQKLVQIRIRLGKWLTLALDFALATDIMLTVVAPTWDDIGRLAVIVVLRTVLNYTLDKEIAREEDRQRQATSVDHEGNG